MIALERMREIFTSGLSGRKPIVPTDFYTLEKKASSKMNGDARGYIMGGAGLQRGMKNNRSAFGSYKVVPRVLTGLSDVDTSIELFGQTYPTPIFAAPIGVLEMVHKQSDLAVAAGCVEAEVPMIISNQSSHPMEAIFSATHGHPAWFQLYWSKSNELVESLVGRAERCGAKGIVVTLDTTVLGWRPMDLNNGFLPFLKGMGIGQYLSDPVFQDLMQNPPDYVQMDTGRPKISPALLKSMHQMLKNIPGGYVGNLKNQYALRAIKLFINIFSRPNIEWNDLQWLRSITDLPIILKGILHPDDAVKAIDYGINGIVVSNHGGRQVDDVVGSLDMLPSIHKTIAGRIPILIDSGFRSGTDVFKAMALGASGVLIGRPYVYGLALNGSSGVADVFKNLRAELELTMTLCGCKTLSNMPSEVLYKQ